MIWLYKSCASKIDGVTDEPKECNMNISTNVHYQNTMSWQNCTIIMCNLNKMEWGRAASRFWFLNTHTFNFHVPSDDDLIIDGSPQLKIEYGGVTIVWGDRRSFDNIWALHEGNEPLVI